VVISLVKPRFSGRLDEWLAQNPQLSPYALSAAMPALQLDAQLQGRIDFSVNLFSNHYVLAIRGESETQGELGGARFGMRSQSLGDSFCQLELKRDFAAFAQLWNANPLPADMAALKDQIRMLDCAYPGGKSISLQDGAILSQSGPVRLYFTSQPQGEQLSARLYATMVDSEVSPAGDAVLRLLNAAPLAAYGKQNLALDMTYAGPKPWQGASPATNAPFSFTLSQLNVHNQLYQMKLSGALSHAPSGTQQNTKLSLNSEASFTAAYDQYLQKSTQDLLLELYTRPEPQLKPLQEQLAHLDPGRLNDALQPALPVLHSLGNMAAIIDLEATTQTGSPLGSYTLKNLQFNSTPYGIAARGSAMLSAPLLAQGDVGISCRNCLQMIDDAGSYYMRVKQAAITVDPQMANAFTLTPALFAAYKQIVADIGQPDAAQPATLNFQLISDAKAMSINGLNITQLMDIYNRRMAAALQAKP
jgi:hypothetical protein